MSVHAPEEYLPKGHAPRDTEEVEAMDQSKPAECAVEWAAPSGRTWSCTRRNHHIGDHIGANYITDMIMARWPKAGGGTGGTLRVQEPEEYSPPKVPRDDAEREASTLRGDRNGDCKSTALGWFCSRAPGHRGDHVASQSFDHRRACIVARWPNEKPDLPEKSRILPTNKLSVNAPLACPSCGKAVYEGRECCGRRVIRPVPGMEPCEHCGTPLPAREKLPPFMVVPPACPYCAGKPEKRRRGR